MQTIKPPNSDIHSRFSWVRVVFCFRDSARSCAPSEPISFSEYGNISLMYSNINSLNSNIPLRFSQVRVVFCFRDSARACAPSEPIPLPEYGNISLILPHVFKHKFTQLQHTSKVQPGEGGVLLQRLSQSLCSFRANEIV